MIVYHAACHLEISTRLSVVVAISTACSFSTQYFPWRAGLVRAVYLIWLMFLCFVGVGVSAFCSKGWRFLPANPGQGRPFFSPS